jgi:cell division protein FtsQ
VSVRGASPAVTRQVRDALRGDLGTSLLRVDLEQAQTAVTALPTVAAVSFDRAFPHTLRVTILPERPVAVLRQGAGSWLVSARGRVIAVLRHGARAQLPRIWVAPAETFTVGAMVADDLRPALEAASPLGAVRFPARVSSVQTTEGELTLVLRSGIEVRLGDARDVPLKLVVAANVLPHVTSDTRYVDVSVPERPVSGSRLEPAAPPPEPTTVPSSTATTTAATNNQTLKSQVEGQVTTSTGP